MKVGDLVFYKCDGPIFYPDDPCESLGCGLVMSFDKDGDPVVRFLAQDRGGLCGDEHLGSAFYKRDIVVINEAEVI